MKLVHTSDWHIGRSLNGYSLLEDQRYFLSQLVDFLVEYRVDALLISGDLYDRAIPSAQAVQLVDEFLTEVVLRRNIKTFIIAGNHDSPERLSFSNRFLESSGLYMQGNLQREIKKIPLVCGDESVVIWMLPYFHPAQVRELYPEEKIVGYQQAAEKIASLISPSPNTLNLLMAHGFYLNGSAKDGCLYSESEYSVGGSDLIDLGVFPKFDYVALGHLHAPQSAGANGFYSGSPLKYSLSEEKQKKGIVLLEIQNKTIQQSLYSFQTLRDVRKIQGKFQELMLQQSDDYVFVELLDQEYVLNAMEQLRVRFPNILGMHYSSLEYQQPLLEGEEPALSQSPKDILKKFYLETVGNEMTHQEEQLVDQILLQLDQGGKP